MLKNTIKILLAFLLIISLTACGNANIQDVSEESNTVEADSISSTVEDYWVVTEQSRYEGDVLTSRFQYIYENGHQSETLSYQYDSFNNTETTTREVMEYDVQKGKETGSKTYDAETGDLVSWTKTENDNENNPKRRQSFRYDGKLENETVYTNAPDRRTTEYIVYDDNGIITFRMISENTLDGQPLSSRMYDSDGNLMSSTETEFDDTGKVVRTTNEFTTSFFSLSTVTEYIYDTDGILRQTVEETDGRNTSITEYQYDQYGNRVESTVSQNGIETSKTLTIWGRMHNRQIVEVSGAPANSGEYTLVQSAPEENASPSETKVSVQEHHRIALAKDRILAVCDNGDVLYAGIGSGSSSGAAFSSWKWKNIVAVDMCFNGPLGHYLGLRADGTVVGDGFQMFGENNTDGWENIIQIMAMNDLSYGLTDSGEMVALGVNKNGECDMKGITDAVGFYNASAFDDYAVVVRRDGTLAVVGVVPEWLENIDMTAFTDTLEVSFIHGCLFILNRDGTVTSTDDIFDVSSWTGITRIVSGNNAVIGLREDGSVCASCVYGFKEFGDIVSDWTGIVDAKVTLNGVLGLRDDGTIITTDDQDLSAFSDVREFYLIERYGDPNGDLIVGVRNDGTVITNDPDLQSQVMDWKLF